jgi:hypothetical protein
MKSLKKIFCSLLIVSITVTSCDLDVNVDPNSPATVPSSQLLSTAQVAIFSSFGVGASGVGQVASIWTHQTMIRSAADAYASTGTDANIVNAWTNLYSGGLLDIEQIIAQSTDKEEYRFVGIAKLLKAFSYSTMVDVWGDIPFSEACQGAANPFPKFDDDEEIYGKLFLLIDEGIADLGKTVPAISLNPAADDLIYGGDVAKWRRFGKVLKLKMYNTIRKKQSVGSEIATLAADPDVAAFVDDFELNYVNVAAPANRNPGWLSVSGATTYFHRWLYEIMSSRTATGTGFQPSPPAASALLNPIYSGLQDPRLVYYMYNSLGSSNLTPQNPTELRDGNFLGINFSSQSVNQGFDQSRGLSMPGLYYSGGKFDNAGVGGTILVSSAPGNAPQRLLCRYEVTYILAELALDGVITGNARTLLSTAIDQSFAKLDVVRARVAPTAPSITTAARDAYKSDPGGVLTRYDAASAAGKLEHILTQKWIANFGNPLAAYTDYRRTGLPKMFDPATDNDPNTNLGRAYPFSYPWRQLDTRQLNPNAPEQKLIGDPSARVFWDVD